METIVLVEWLIDGLIGFGLLCLAWLALSSKDLFKAIIVFVGFGLLMAISWLRLNAVDVALAEAAIGAGLTGALLMAALARLQGGVRASSCDHGEKPGSNRDGRENQKRAGDEND